MKFNFPVIISLMLIFGCSGPKDTAEQLQDERNTSISTSSLLSYQKAVTPQYLRTHLTAFAADSMEGRETGMPGQKKAAEYLSAQYSKLGLQPVGDNNTYLQKFDLTATRTDSVVFQTFAIESDSTETPVSKSVSSKTSSANYIRQYGGEKIVNAEIIFGGFGMRNDSLNIDHLKGKDLKGKWVMILDGAPMVVDGDTLYTEANEQQTRRDWLRNIIQQDVAGVLSIANTGGEFNEAAKANRVDFGKATGMQLPYRAEDNGGPGWSLTQISPSQAAAILNLPTGSDSLKDLKEEVTQNIKTFSAQKTGHGLTQIPYTNDVTIETENVAALLKGADPKLKDQVVVLSAHYDHVGIGAPDSTGDAIYNGANDDGSGTIGILNAARAFSRAKENGVQPRRSVLFLSVSGEEKGLLGSRYYSDHPIFPMEKTVANINTDMIGRVDPEHKESGETDYVYIIGADIISSQLDSLLKAGNARAANLKLDMRYNDLNDPNQFYRRSDHWNFGRFGVPFAFFFNGVHEDYHRPSDEVEKMNFDLYAKTVRSIYAATVMVANADSAPGVDNRQFIEITEED